jgi:hypothetical protein
MEPQTSNSAQGRRRRTVFRKLRQLCDEFDLSAMVVLIDNAGRQWIFKTDDNVAATREVRVGTDTVYDNLTVIRCWNIHVREQMMTS